MERINTRPIKVGNVQIGGQNKVVIQSMTNTKTKDIKETVNQILELEKAGCEIIRVACLDLEDAKAIEKIKKQIHIPIVADIHFDYKIALEAIKSGVDKIRINPGNIGEDSRVKAVADACARAGVPIRIGVNSGSLEKHILAKYGAPTARAMAESALYHASLLEKYDFSEIVLSVKSAEVPVMREAYQILAEECEYPLHWGVTHAGTRRMGVMKNAIGIGSLLLDGIGDTIRVSLTDSPVEEVRAGYDILSACGIRRRGPQMIACPTCGRCQIDLIGLANRVEEALASCEKEITVAVMGCVVNGPGEARECDLGIAGGKDCAVLFRRGEILRKVREEEILPALLEEIERYQKE